MSKTSADTNRLIEPHWLPNFSTLGWEHESLREVRLRPSLGLVFSTQELTLWNAIIHEQIICWRYLGATSTRQKRLLFLSLYSVFRWSKMQKAIIWDQ